MQVLRKNSRGSARKEITQRKGYVPKAGYFGQQGRREKTNRDRKMWQEGGGGSTDCWRSRASTCDKAEEGWGKREKKKKGKSSKRLLPLTKG